MRGAIFAIAFALGGCSLFESLPDKSCTKTSDCFQAQGEVCSQDTHQCVAGPDAQIATPAPSPEQVTP